MSICARGDWSGVFGRWKMEMDSHGGLEVTIRQTESKKKKNYPTTSLNRPLSARNEHQSHPLAGQAQACGAPSSGGWTEGPMAPVETTDAATVDQRCSFKHWAGWRHNHSNSKLCVTARMGQANLLCITSCRPCTGAMLSSRSDFQQLDLCGRR